jgi:hypothetical protein
MIGNIQSLELAALMKVLVEMPAALPAARTIYLATDCKVQIKTGHKQAGEPHFPDTMVQADI